MGWMQTLYETYENNKEYAGKVDDTGSILLPIGHSTQNAQIEAAIDLDGSFKGAERVPKAQAVTVIPVTEDSVARSSGIAPHPLCDKLCYVAGDYEQFCVKKNAAEFYRAYIDQLRAWTEEENCHEWVKAIWRYLEKGTLIADLLKEKVLLTDDDGRLSAKEKVEGIAQVDSFVRFRIQDFRVEGSGELWNNRQIYDNYISHCLKIQQSKDLDYISGEQMPCSEKQPSKIRNSADKAKLISANDTSGFTFRGRFADRAEAVSIGYRSSQEAHSALKWLLERQGYRKHGTAIVAWSPEGKKIPGIFEDDEEDLGLLYLEQKPETEYHYAKKVKNAILGKYEAIDNPTDKVAVIALDAATPGRLSVTYYREMAGSDFLERLLYWHTKGMAELKYIKGSPVGVPRPEEIVQAAFGIERKNWLEVDEKLMKSTLERLLPCILDKRPIPMDLIRCAAENASHPLNYSPYNRQKIRTIACVMLRKRINCDKEDNEMALDKQCRDRSYLYGRLLALAHKLEEDTYSQEEKGKRETNATRYTTIFSRRPARTWMVIKQRLAPYYKKLPPQWKNQYDRTEREISDLFDMNDFQDNTPLKEVYILGYECQISDFYKANKKEENTYE